MCPPERQILFSRQRWNVLAPLRKQKLDLAELDDTRRSLNGPQYFCVRNHSINALGRLYNPLGNSSESSANILGRTELQKALAVSYLERLPSELLKAIYAMLDPKDVICLGLCSQTLWNHAVWVVRGHYRSWSRQFSWAGTPIILTGSHLGLLPQAIYDICPDSKPNDEPSSHTLGIIDWIRALPRRWNSSAVASYDEVLPPVHDVYQKEFQKFISLSGIPKRLHPGMASCLDLSTTVSTDGWYLRNLTTKEYIRMEFVRDLTDAKRTTVALTGHRWLTLDILLMWLISWSVHQFSPRKLPCWDDDDDELEMRLEDVLRRGRVCNDTLTHLTRPFQHITIGKWAGNSLDVVDGAFKEMSDGWSDCTDTIEKLSRRWFAAMYGEELKNDHRPHYKRYWAQLARMRENAI